MKVNPAALLAGIVGVTLLILSVPLAHAGREPFVTWFYPIAWYGLILFMDSVRAAYGKRSLIFHAPLCFVALVFWSAVLWFLFEAFNFRLANWYYVFVQDSEAERILGSWLSFGTVLPAVFLIEKLLEDMGVFKTGPSISLRFNDRLLTWAVVAGILCLVLPMALPLYCFPLIWAFGFLLPLPLVARRARASLLGDLEAGRAGRLMRILVAGMICGFIWEFLNHFARTRWIYTVPFLEDLKLFEMPPLGFLGFPPFALECTVMYGALVGLGLAPGIKGLQRRESLGSPKILPAALSIALGLAFGLFVLQGMERYTFDSYVPRPRGLDLPAPVLSLARSGGHTDCFDLREGLKNPVLRSMLKDQGVDMKEVADLLDLALLRGIGTDHARALARAGVHSVEDLAREDAGALAAALEGEERDRGGRVRRSRTFVWIKAAMESQQ